MDSQEVESKAGQEAEECDYEEEGGEEEEALEDDVYLDVDSDTYNECIQDVELGVKLGFTPKKTMPRTLLLCNLQQRPRRRRSQCHRKSLRPRHLPAAWCRVTLTALCSIRTCRR